jgi:hypothetical protein
MGPHAGVYYNLTLCPLQSRLQHIYHGHDPIPELTLSPSKGVWIWPHVYSAAGQLITSLANGILKVHKKEKFFGFDFEFCTISMLIIYK